MKNMYDIRMLCKVVNLHHSVYYYHKQNRKNSYKTANIELDKKIKEEFEKSKKRYGSPKITKVLNSQGIKVSQKRVARRMKELGLRSIIVKKFNHSGSKKVDDKNKENLLEQDFKATKPSEKWVGDITYIYTKETGWTYLAIVMDLFDLKIIGWSYGINMTAQLVIDAFEKAQEERKVENGMIFHSDLGSQYTSNEYENLLLNKNVKHSYSQKGYPYDNASMESFNAILKKEEVNVNTYETFNEARLEYNNNQTREDRKIEDYFKKVCNSQNDIACVIIIELGDMDFWNDKNEEYRLKMIDVYNEQVKDLIKIVPTFKIANATIHFDETSPHMHIVGVPVVENCTRGMKKQVGKSKIFTKTILTEIQDKMRNTCIKSYNKFYDVDSKLKTKR